MYFSALHWPGYASQGLFTKRCQLGALFTRSCDNLGKRPGPGLFASLHMQVLNAELGAQDLELLHNLYARLYARAKIGGHQLAHALVRLKLHMLMTGHILSDLC